MSNLRQSAEVLDSVEKIRNGRIEWIDYARGIGIILVVYGHVVVGVTDSGFVEAAPKIAQMFVKYSSDFIYTFHMSLFFFLSGLVSTWSSSKSEKSFNTFFWNKAKTIVYPYLVWSIIQGLISVFMSPYTNFKFSITDLPLHILLIPIAQFWFLYTLFTCQILFTLSKKLLNIYIICFLAFLIYFMSPIIKTYFLDDQIIYLYMVWKFMENFVFFVLGVISAKFLPKFLIKLSTRQFFLLSLACIFAQACIFFFATLVLKLVISQDSISVIGFLVAVLGIVSMLCLSIYLERKNLLNVLHSLGFLSMPIYVAHLLSSAGFRVILQKGFHTNNLFLHIFVETIAGLTLPIILYILTKKIRFPYLYSLSKRSSLSLAISSGETTLVTRK